MSAASSPAPGKHEALLAELRGIVGAEHVLTREADRFVYGYDASVFRGTDVVAVTLPRHAHEVSRIVRAARQAGVPVIARGAGTGINGGALPQEPAVVIALARMNSILRVDPDNRLAVVEPGVVNQDLKEHLARLGFAFNYVPDPGSQVVSTLGGNVGNNAGGMHCLKYGVTANHVLGLEVVLPDSRIVRLGGPASGRPGSDLTGLIVGSEGTLGIVTQITLRILPLPETVVTQLALFPTIADAAQAVSGIIAAGILPAALELLDAKMMALVDQHIHVGYPPQAGASLIIELDGLSDGMERELRRVHEVCTAHRSLDVQTARTAVEGQRLWLARRAAYGSVARMSPTFYVIDCTVPRNKLDPAIQAIIGICSRLGLDVVTLAHAGDGNLHPLIPFVRDDPASQAAALQAHHEIMELCVGMGGSITGEHGVGVEKQAELELMYGPDELEAMFRVKQALDAEDLCNPRKIFPLRLFTGARSALAPQPGVYVPGSGGPAGTHSAVHSSSPARAGGA